MCVIAYTYEAEVHCIECAKKAVEQGLLKSDPEHPYAYAARDKNGLSCDLVDRDWNLIHPLFDTSVERQEYCGTCRVLIPGTEMYDGD